VQMLMDVPNYIDYKIAEIFGYRWDIGNHRLWRPRSADGRWRWLQFDNDVAWGGFWAVQPAWAFNMLEADTSTSGSLYGHNDHVRTFLFRKLLANATFKADFINRFADLLNTVYIPTHTIARIDQFAAVLQPEMREHTARWSVPASVEDWSSNVQDLREFAIRRPDVARQQIVKKFGLAGTATLSITVKDSIPAAFLISTIKSTPTPGTNWQGTYFKGVPFSIRALPPPGFQFKEWVGNPGAPSNPLTLTLTNDCTLTAAFEPEAKPLESRQTR